MSDVFFFGTLRDRDLLEIVLGRPVDPTTMLPARAPDFAVFELDDEAYPYMVDASGSSAEGSLVTDLSAEDWARLEYYEEAEYGLSKISVIVGGLPRPAAFFRSTDKVKPTLQPWSFSNWKKREKAVASEAAGELMAHYGIVEQDDIDTIWHGIMIRARMRARAKAEVPVTGLLRSRRQHDDVVANDVGRPYTAYFALEQHRLQHRRFDGSLSDPVDRTVMVSGDAVTIVPYDPIRDEVMLIEQFRAPMYARGDACPWGIEAIAGRIDKETDAEVCARREAVEEGGVSLGTVEIVARYYSTPGIAAEHITSFVGHGDLSNEGGVFGVVEENEDIRAFTCSFDIAMAAVASGEINNAPAILTLMWLNQNRERLRTEWA